VIARRATRWLAALVVGFVAVATGLGPASAQSTPTLDPVTQTVAVGDVVSVSGTGWPAGQMVSVSICGNGGVNGSAYCNLSDASVFPITKDGVLTGRIYVALPAAPCPCVLQIVGAGTSAKGSTPIKIDGAVYAEVPEDQVGAAEAAAGTLPTTKAPSRTPPDPTLQINQVTVEDTSSWTAAFGAAPKRVLHLAVTNTGLLPVKNPLLSIRYGKGESPTFVVDAPEIAVIMPGETINLDVPFELDPLSFGDYTVAGEIGVVGNRVAFSGSTSAWPWGLLIVLIVFLQLVVILLVRRNRRIRRRREAELLAAGDAPGGGEAAAVGVAGSPEVEGGVPGGDGAPTAVTEEIAPTDAGSMGEPEPTAEEATTGPEPTIPPNDIRLDGPVTAAPWH
jgi:hypothetical protein